MMRTKWQLSHFCSESCECLKLLLSIIGLYGSGKTMICPHAMQWNSCFFYQSNIHVVILNLEEKRKKLRNKYFGPISQSSTILIFQHFQTYKPFKLFPLTHSNLFFSNYNLKGAYFCNSPLHSIFCFILFLIKKKL